MKYNTLEEVYSLFLKHPVLSKDTRKIDKGCIYLALKGESFDGNKFADDAIQKGAAYAIIDNEKFKKDERYLLVEDSLAFLQKLANHHRKQFNIPFIAISGSNGKTTTKELIASVLAKKYNVLYTEGNYNNHIGVPLTLLKIQSSHEIAVIEMGANHQNEINFLCNIAEPDYGLLTNIGKAHLEGFGGVEGIKKGKSELYRYLENHNGTIFLNTDDNILPTLVKKDDSVTYGTTEKVYCKGTLIKTHPQLSGTWFCESQKGSISPRLFGEYNFYNILAAICIGNYFKVPEKSIDEGINEYQSTMNRSQVIQKEGYKVIMDAYNANPTSTFLALQNFNKQDDPLKTAILGDMFELGNESAKEHFDMIKAATEMTNISSFVFVGKHYSEHKNNFSDYLFFQTTQEAKSWFSNEDKTNKIYLLKGSRGMAMEKLLEE